MEVEETGRQRKKTNRGREQSETREEKQAKGAGTMAENRARKSRKQDKPETEVYGKIHTENTEMHTKKKEAFSL